MLSPKIESRKKLLLCLILALPLAAQPGVGAKFGTRDPRCGPRKTQGNAAPSPDIVREAVLCQKEGVSGDYLYLIENLKVEVAQKGRALQISDRMPDIDNNVPIYPIRGSLTAYQCRLLVNAPAGQNCMVTEQSNAGGQCYKNTWGEWVCSLTGFGDPKYKMPAPPKQ
jgi:hypothetical protein